MRAEPEADSTEPFINIGFRLPNGKTIKRRFYRDQMIQDLHDFVMVQDNTGFDEEDTRDGFELLNGYPRKALKDEDMEKAIGEMFTKNQEMFIVNPKISL